MQVIKNIFFETWFVTNNKPPFKNTYAWLFRLIYFEFLLFCKCLSKGCCLNKVIFPVTVVKILRYIQHALTCKNDGRHNYWAIMLSKLFRHVTLPMCFERFDWSLVIGYLVAANIAIVLWTYEDEKFNTSDVILCPVELSNFRYKLLMLKKFSNKMIW